MRYNGVRTIETAVSVSNIGSLFYAFGLVDNHEKIVGLEFGQATRDEVLPVKISIRKEVGE